MHSCSIDINSFENEKNIPLNCTRTQRRIQDFGQGGGTTPPPESAKPMKVSHHLACSHPVYLSLAKDLPALRIRVFNLTVDGMFLLIFEGKRGQGLFELFLFIKE